MILSGVYFYPFSACLRECDLGPRGQGQKGYPRAVQGLQADSASSGFPWRKQVHRSVFWGAVSIYVIDIFDLHTIERRK